MSKDPAVYLSHILECIDLVEAYITGMSLGEFEEKQQVQDAVLRRIEIIGEAVKNLCPLSSSQPDMVPARSTV